MGIVSGGVKYKEEGLARDKRQTAKIRRLMAKIAKIFACGAIVHVSNGTKLDYFTAQVDNLYKKHMYSSSLSIINNAINQ